MLELLIQVEQQVMELDCWISLLKIIMSKVEQTLSLIKPDAVERNLEEEIKQFFIKSGFIMDKVCSVLLIMVFYKFI